MGAENIGKVGPAYDPITGLITDSDLVWVQGNATLDGTLQINLNGVNPGAWAWYDVLVANQITITDGKLDLVGLSSWRIIQIPATPTAKSCKSPLRNQRASPSGAASQCSSSADTFSVDERPDHWPRFWCGPANDRRCMACLRKS